MVEKHCRFERKKCSRDEFLGLFACEPEHEPSPFFVQEKEKRETRKKNSFKAETIKRLPPTSKCYYFSHSRPSKIQILFLPANHGG